MKKLLFILFTLISINTCFAQNSYFGLRYNSDFSVELEKHTNHVVGINFGHFITNIFALEVDYTHGFKKPSLNDLSYNRIGLNIVHEFKLEKDPKAAPYFKLGVGYKEYEIHNNYSTSCWDVKAQLGFIYYTDYNFGIDLGFGIIDKS